MNPPPIPTCGPGEPVLGCCSVAIPNTSEWAIVCTNAAQAPSVVPTLTEGGALLFAVLLVVAAIRRLR